MVKSAHLWTFFVSALNSVAAFVFINIHTFIRHFEKTLCALSVRGKARYANANAEFKVRINRTNILNVLFYLSDKGVFITGFATLDIPYANELVTANST